MILYETTRYSMDHVSFRQNYSAISPDTLSFLYLTNNFRFCFSISFPSTFRAVSSTKTFTENDLASDRSQRSKAKAPLVDSTLLRFLSEQKNSRSVLLDDDTEKPYASETISIEAPNSRKRGVEVDYPKFASDALSIDDSSQLETTDLPTINGDSSVKSTENQSWLSQYNAQRMTLKLQALGVESEAANEVGKIVQDYVLARITRRRIRKFLQERDAMWESGVAVSDDRSGINENISFAAASKFDIDAVISVMTEYGLTGTDIAAVLSHTPSVAMMMARKTSDNETMAGRKSFTLQDTLDKAFVGLLGETLKLRRYDARKVRSANSFQEHSLFYRLFTRTIRCVPIPLGLKIMSRLVNIKRLGISRASRKADG